MGYKLNCHCQCGYKKEVILGGGIRHQFTISYFPHLCTSCCEIVNVNILEQKKKCPECLSTEIICYTNPKLRLGEVGEELATCGEQSLYFSWYRCPNCTLYEMRFRRPHCLFD